MTRRPLLLLVPAAVLVAGSALLASGPAALSAPAASAYECETTHSHVLYKTKHLGASWSYGRFDDFTAGFMCGDGGADLSSVNFTVKAESVNSQNPKRDGHIKSPDFLNAKQFPEITFKSTAAKAIDADTTEVTGDLTLHGVTKPLTVKVVRVGTGKNPQSGQDLVGFETTFTIKRTDFGVSYGVPAVSDDVQMTVAVEGAKK
jgi:polyisoprenoid-binding protein YceI